MIKLITCITCNSETIIYNKKIKALAFNKNKKIILIKSSNDKKFTQLNNGIYFNAF